jgi:hypothetical protein
MAMTKENSKFGLLLGATGFKTIVNFTVYFLIFGRRLFKLEANDYTFLYFSNKRNLKSHYEF